jgi:ABC-type multidrug transport system fused ATPase/permease subunit
LDKKKSSQKSNADPDDGMTEEQLKLIDDIIQAEDRAKGSMSWDVVRKWINYIGGGPRVFFLLTTMVVWSLTKGGVPWFLQFWSTHYGDHKGNKKEDIEIFLGIYLSTNFIQILCDFIRTKTIFNGNVQMSKEVTFLMTFRLMHASISKFFDRVPLGRILNRFMKDV